MNVQALGNADVDRVFGDREAVTPKPGLQALSIERLSGSCDPFSQLAFPRLRPHLVPLQPPWLAIGARWNGVPAGLALASVVDGQAMLHSVFVTAMLRRKGIGSDLLAVLMREARSEGATKITTQYSSFLQKGDAFEALLARGAWEKPAVMDIMLVGLAGAMAEGGGAWRPVQRAMRALGVYRFEPFVIDGRDDDASIQRLLEDERDLGVPDPRGNEAIDRDLSLTLRHHGHLVGWIAAERLTHSIGIGTLVPGATSIHYSGARLAKGHHKALMLVGYYKAFSRQAELYGPSSRAVYRTHPRAAAMYTFTRQRFAPMALHIEERYASSRTLDMPLEAAGPTAGAAPGC